MDRSAARTSQTCTGFSHTSGSTEGFTLRRNSIQKTNLKIGSLWSRRLPFEKNSEYCFNASSLNPVPIFPSPQNRTRYLTNTLEFLRRLIITSQQKRSKIPRSFAFPIIPTNRHKIHRISQILQIILFQLHFCHSKKTAYFQPIQGSLGRLVRRVFLQRFDH